MSFGSTKVSGTKPSSLLPTLACSRERFLHRRSLRPISNEPGKWLNCVYIWWVHEMNIANVF